MGFIAISLGESMDEQFIHAHAQRMLQKKASVHEAIARSSDERGVVLLVTGPGKGKSSSAFGMLYRALGHGLRVGLVQFISGTHTSGEITFLHQLGWMGQGGPAPVDYHAMATGCTWNSTDWSRDKQAADMAWQQALRMLGDAQLSMVVLDELTFMLKYRYLQGEQLLDAIACRPPGMHVVITGRDAPQELYALADTVSEIADVKHAFRQGVKAQPGVDY